jgi:hypothetical protein
MYRCSAGSVSQCLLDVAVNGVPAPKEEAMTKNEQNRLVAGV